MSKLLRNARYIVSGPSSGEVAAYCVIDTRKGKPISWWSGGRQGADEEAARLNATVTSPD